jgi:superfamily II DNA/RNA helicase
MKFADLGLSDELLQAVADAGYDEPTPIQAQAIPPVLMMKDIIGIAQTGTGKTASFVLPMIDILAHGRSRARMPRSLILEPTRELAAQVAENFEKYGKNHNLSMALLIGGVSMGDQIKALEKGVDVLIATPGRLMDLFERGRILMSGCELLVIDEADRMLDMGFIPDIEQICSKLPSTRQTMLFSATMPPPIKKLSDQFLNNPKSVEVSRPATANTSIDQSIIHLAPKAKRQTLYGILDNDGVDTAIIFCNRKTEVRDLCEQMRKDGFDAGQIHGDMDQSSRLAELERFKSGEINILCASDVAARGLDIKGVSHVVNYDIPWHPDDYIHRIGRTGRAGATGVAITFVTKRDDEHVDSIEKLTGMKLPVRDLKSIKPEKRQSGKKTVADKPKSEKPKKPHSDDRRADKPKRPEKSAKPAKSIPKPETADETDDGWNGPVPGFLGAKFDR